MHILKDSIQTNFLQNNDVIIDIETTGVSRNSSNVIVVGLLFPDSVEDNFLQYAVSDVGEEKDLLEIINELLKAKNIISFNGEVFDLPFLKSRMNSYGITPFIEKSQFDIYRYIVSNKHFLNLENFSLQSVEKFYGIERYENFELENDIRFYSDLLNDEIISSIMLHNKNDVLNTEKILNIYHDTEDIKSFYVKLNSEKIRVKIDRIMMDKDFLNIYLISDKIFDYRFENSDYYMGIEKGKIQIRMRILQGYIDKNKIGVVHHQKIKPYIKNPCEILENMLLIYTDEIYNLSGIKMLIDRLFRLFIK
ncbi:MAG: ribonuclease H-like domain-containing protein [Tissierellia bacterium]|nr:ribonuclease H-like domain-containing protein [Tissierellia bacterium]